MVVGESDSPWVLFLGFSVADVRLHGWFVVSVVRGLDLGGGEQIELSVQAMVVPPPDVFEGRQLDLLDRAPGALTADQLGLVETVHCLREGVVIAVPDGPGRRFRTELDDAIV